MIKEYLAYLRDNPEGYWFKAKLYGWGWVPVRWEGWVTLIAFIAILFFNFFRLDANSHSASDTIRPFIIQTAVLVALLLYICWRKGEKPRWRWGVPDKYKK